MLAADAINAAEWHSTNYISPHEYMLFRENSEAYQALYKMIKLHGKIEQFQGRPYKYSYFEGYKYWCIQNVINRARV